MNTVAERMEAAGFQLHGTGGGCTGWYKQDDDGAEVLVSYDLSAEGDPDDPEWCVSRSQADPEHAGLVLWAVDVYPVTLWQALHVAPLLRDPREYGETAEESYTFAEWARHECRHALANPTGSTTSVRDRAVAVLRELLAAPNKTRPERVWDEARAVVAAAAALETVQRTPDALEALRGLRLWVAQFEDDGALDELKNAADDAIAAAYGHLTLNEEK